MSMVNVVLQYGVSTFAQNEQVDYETTYPRMHLTVNRRNVQSS